MGALSALCYLSHSHATLKDALLTVLLDLGAPSAPALSPAALALKLARAQLSPMPATEALPALPCLIHRTAIRRHAQSTVLSASGRVSTLSAPSRVGPDRNLAREPHWCKQATTGLLVLRLSTRDPAILRAVLSTVY